MGYLDKLDLDKKLDSKQEYEELLEQYQFRLLKLQRKIDGEGISVCVAYEGEDAAGKGGNIKRLTETLDPRGYEVHPIGAPSAEEKAHHWLRRFWLRLPHAGASPSSIAPGMAACWWSGWRSSPRKKSGNAPTGRSTNLSGHWRMMAWCW